jgi:hypothetical protein
MIKKDLKKATAFIKSGYANGKPVVDIDIDTVTVGRIDTMQLERFIERRIRGGMFKFIEGGRKYQRIELI